MGAGRRRRGSVDWKLETRSWKLMTGSLCPARSALGLNHRIKFPASTPALRADQLPASFLCRSTPLAILRLAVLDVDGTLKRAESPYQYLHERLGVAHLAAENRELALAARISYGEWLRRDALLWAGQPVAKISGLLAENPYLPGAPELLRRADVGRRHRGVGQCRVHAQHRSHCGGVRSEVTCWPTS